MDIHTSIAEAIELFNLDNAARRLTSATRVQYVNSLRVFERWCADAGVASLQDVSATVVRKYLVYLSGRTNAHGEGLSAEYVHGLARAVRRLCRFAVDEEILAVTPFSKVKMPKLVHRVLRDLKPEEVEEVLRACKTRRDRALVALMVDTGIRANELCALTIADVDLSDGAILVRQGKGQRERWLFAGKRARAFLRLYLADRGRVGPNAPLFASQRGGGKMRTNGIVLLFRRLQKASGVSHATAHAMRRTFAMTCLRNGMDIHSLRLLMGHQDDFMLKRYLSFSSSDLQAMHAKYSPLDNFQ